MLDGKLRIAPTCYHVLHQVPVMTAHEMNFLYDEGLTAADWIPICAGMTEKGDS